MIPVSWKIGAGVALAILLVWGGFATVGRYRHGQGAKGEQQAHQAEVAAVADTAKAQASDAQLPAIQAQLQAQTSRLATVAQERDALLKRVSDADAIQPVSPGASGAEVGNAPSPCLEELQALRALVAKDAEVIRDQADVLQSKDIEIQILTTSRDSWKASSEQRERQALAQQAATEAWKKAVLASRWQGRIEGFAAGVAVGFVGGRLK